MTTPKERKLILSLNPSQHSSALTMRPSIIISEVDTFPLLCLARRLNRANLLLHDGPALANAVMIEYFVVADPRNYVTLRQRATH